MRIPESPYLGAKFDELMVPMETYRIVLEFQNEDPDGSQRRELLSRTRQCPECGAVFPCATVRDEFRLVAHRKAHFYADFRCDCPEAAHITTMAQKKVHIKLVHSEGRY